MTKKLLASWLMKQHCVEFNDDKTATYYLHLDINGRVKTPYGETILTETVDISEWADDDSPERFYREFERTDNPEFMKVVKSFAKQLKNYEK